MKEVFNKTRLATVKYYGYIDEIFDFIQDFQLLRSELWRRFVEQFRHDADYDAGWRGEYWGKMMCGASLVYSYTKNFELYDILKETMHDMINSADENGRISSYAVEHEFDGWDIWGRKYVLLGMQYFLEVCNEPDFRADIIASMCKQMDYIIDNIGAEDTKIEITSATRHWRGLNSSSLLEPVVKLYNLTGDKRYFDFATYIVERGGTDVINIFETAYENKLYPYQYPVTKAYEMTSCFEGLIEYYKITGNEKYKKAIINFADKILESDFTVIGGCGCSHELFDHSSVRQANTTNGLTMQETCVTVTLMKFFYRVHLLTGDSKYVDAFEISFFNAYLGSLNTEKVIEPLIIKEHPDWIAEPLPFDSYSPLTASTRGNGIGGLKVMSDNHYYGCCACIGSVGIGLLPILQIVQSAKGFVINMYINGEVSANLPNDNKVTFNIQTEYPKHGEINISMSMDVDEEFELLLRNPFWSKNTTVKVNGSKESINGGYIKLERLWKNGDSIEIVLDMNTEAIYPIPYGNQILMNKVVWGKNYIVPTYDEEDSKAKKHIALRRGPIMLAQENRLGYNVDDEVEIVVRDDRYVDVVVTDKEIPYKSILKVEVPLRNGGTMTTTDYSSAGKLWNNESKMAVWMLTK